MNNPKFRIKRKRYVYQYDTYYDKKTKKTKQYNTKYLGLFTGTCDKAGKPNYIPAKSSASSLGTMRFWSFVGDKIEEDQAIKNKTTLQRVIKKISTPDMSLEEFDKFLSSLKGKQVFNRSYYNNELEEICSGKPLYYSSWVQPLSYYLEIFFSPETQKLLPFLSNSHLEDNLQKGYLKIYTGDMKKLMKNLRWEKDVFILSKEVSDDKNFFEVFHIHELHLYSNEKISYFLTQQLRTFVKGIYFFDNIFPILINIIFEVDMEEGHDFSPYREMLNLLAIKLYQIFSQMEEFDMSLIKHMLTHNPSLIKVSERWFLLDERYALH